jgi:dephospho-CoA kinase
MKIIAFTGMPLSGKSEAVRVAEEKGIKIIRMGDLVWESTKKEGLNLSDKNIGLIANRMREKYGKDIWARKTMELINSNLVVIDGVRNKEEVEYFKKVSDHFILIAIKARDELRKERALARGREDDRGDISERDRRELGWGIEEVIACADITISNNGKLDDFRKEVKRILDTITDDV